MVHFVTLARQVEAGFQMGDRLITQQGRAFIIAKVGNKHNGDIELAKPLVDLALRAGAECVNFQMRDLITRYSNLTNNTEAGYDLGSQYSLDLHKRFQLRNDKFCEVFD